MTTTVTVSCPTSGCSNSHTAVVDDKEHDRAETQCAKCGNIIVIKTHNGDVVSVEVS